MLERSIPFCYYSAEGNHSFRLQEQGYHTVTPFVISRDPAKLLDFLQEAFGAEEIARVYNEDGATIGHAETRISDSVVMMFDAKQGGQIRRPSSGYTSGDCECRLPASAESRGYLSNRADEYALGRPVRTVRDPLGNLWWIMTRIEDVDEAEMEKRAGQKEYIDAMWYVQNAQFFRSDKPDP